MLRFKRGKWRVIFDGGFREFDTKEEATEFLVHGDKPVVEIPSVEVFDDEIDYGPLDP